MTNKFAKLILILGLASASAFAQLNTFTTTTLSAAVTSTTATIIQVASNTGINAPSLSNGAFGGGQSTVGSALFVDGELMQVNGVSGTTISVQRGTSGTQASTHLSGVQVIIGNPDWYRADAPGAMPSGSCTQSTLYAFPIIEIIQQEILTCDSTGVYAYAGPALADGGLPWARTTVTGNYTAKFSDLLLAYTSTSSAYTLTLPAASSMPGKVFIIDDESGGAGTHNITVTTANGCASISSNYGSCRVRSNGTAWFAF